MREAAEERFDHLELHTLAPFVVLTDQPRAVEAEIPGESGSLNTWPSTTHWVPA